MALALTNNFKEFYENKFKEKFKESFKDNAEAIFGTVVKAPWMSSGLTANNAFSTTLVLRLFGFLEQQGLFGDRGSSLQTSLSKTWELHLGIKNVVSLASKIKEHADVASEYLWLSLSDKTRGVLAKLTPEHLASANTELGMTLKAALSVDLRNKIQSGWIYDEMTFDKASTETKQRLDRRPTGYVLAEVNHCLLADQYPDEIAKPISRSLKDIAALMAGDANNFSINEYPSSAAVMYWFVDGIVRAKIVLTGEQWHVLGNWAGKEFNHERSLVLAEHDAMMDPIAMGMSACLCAQLRAISDEAQLGATKEHLAILPSMVELEHSIEELFSKQTRSGIWNKYFPLFHYQDAGSNFCFTFELLEAVLHEFGGEKTKLLANLKFVQGLEKAVGWCEENPQKCPEESVEYTGWNSGGYIETLKKGQPESWATAVVHMFLWELKTAVSEHIQREILRKYNARLPKERSKVPARKEESAIAELLDVDVLLPGRTERVSDILWTRVISNYNEEDESSLRYNPAKKKPHSALLFGPPGTSKTIITKAVAADLGWPLIELTPSNFVRDSLANVYQQTEDIFQDLLDLAGVVVLFDEMDALVQTRDVAAHLDIVSQFLTTTMLPKLSLLHDNAQVVFFMATNFQEHFDPAIKRTGRFDLLICMGPPKLSEKLDRLHKVYHLQTNNEQTIKAGKLIREYLLERPGLEDQLELYTFGDFRSFVKTIGDENNIGNKVEEMGKAKFEEALEKDSNYVALKLVDIEPLFTFFKCKRLSEIVGEHFTLKFLIEQKIPTSTTVQFLCDQKESREQW